MGELGTDPRFSTPRYFVFLESFRKQSEEFFEFWTGQIIPLMPGSNGRILDVGFGYGVFLKIMAQKGYAVEGVDVSDIHCKHLQTTVLTARAHPGSLTSAPVFENLERRRFSLVSFWDCLQYISDAVEQLRVADRLLNPGGLLIVQTPNRSNANLRYARRLSIFHPELARFFLHKPAAKVFLDPAMLDKWIEHLGEGYELLSNPAWRGKPRFVLDLHSPKAFIEGMLLSGWAVVARMKNEETSPVHVFRKLPSGAPCAQRQP
jgi:2-polyprenyl-3-methyl-5-hydroxy-6-metoxy-1,4-benzoquinol methylase